MAANTTIDILIELSVEEILKLSRYYSQRQDDAPHIHSHLENALAWHEETRQEEVKIIQIFAPHGEPAVTNGTFVSVAHFPWNMIITFTMEASCKLLLEVLTKTKRFNYKKDNYLFYAVHEKHVPVLDNAMTELGLKKVVYDKTDLWLLNQEDAISKTPSYPMEYVMEPVNVADATKINEIWPHKADNSEIYVRTLIKYNGGWGMYTKAENELVGWVLKSQIGQLALLQVIEAHQHKGLAEALIYALSKEIAMEGFPVLATIIQTNEASKRLFTKCGFKSEFMAAFLMYK